MILPRRSFLTGLGALITAPTIVRAESLMKVRGVILPRYVTVDKIMAQWHAELDAILWRISAAQWNRLAETKPSSNYSRPARLCPSDRA